MLSSALVNSSAVTLPSPLLSRMAQSLSAADTGSLMDRAKPMYSCRSICSSGPAYLEKATRSLSRSTTLATSLALASGSMLPGTMPSPEADAKPPVMNGSGGNLRKGSFLSPPEGSSFRMNPGTSELRSFDAGFRWPAQLGTLPIRAPRWCANAATNDCMLANYLMDRTVCTSRNYCINSVLVPIIKISS